MPALLLVQPLLQRLEQLVPAQRLELGLLLGAEVFLGELAQPFLGNGGLLQRLLQRLHPLEDRGEDGIEAVEMALVLHQAGAGEIVEILDLVLRQLRLHAFQQREIFPQRDGDFGGAKIGEEAKKHAATVSGYAGGSSSAGEAGPA